MANQNKNYSNKGTKYIFICGGVMSGIGKGIATSSIGKLLQSRGFKVSAIKIDPYVNVDAGTMNPIEHGEVFVTGDGAECDQDVGNYERFLDIDISALNYMTTGKIYYNIIQRERNLEFKGKCISPIPHIPEVIIEQIKKVAKNTKSDFVLIEIGGTVGEYENLLFLEAARMMHLREPESVLFILVSYLPIPKMIGEMKTKPTQHAVRSLNTAGIQPDFIIARSEQPVDEIRKEKISLFCNLRKEDIISAPDIKSIYEVPLNFEEEKLSEMILNKFNLKSKNGSDLKKWKALVNIIQKNKKEVKIGVIGKYFQTGSFTLADSYISVIEAIKHASWHFKREPKLFWLNAEEYEKNPAKLKELKNFDGIIVPGGFGGRGVEGKILAIEFCRKNKIPFLGLCYGMQLAVIEFARNVCKLDGAHTTEVNPNTEHPVIDLLPEQRDKIKNKNYGGTMRLGDYFCNFKKGTISSGAYKQNGAFERHRHRYEFNNNYKEIFEKNGLIFAGQNPDRNLMEIIEIGNHPFFVATQFHPEFKSRPLNPHPLFKEFIQHALL